LASSRSGSEKILTNFSLPGYQRARCWIDEFPNIPRLSNPNRIIEIEGSSGETVKVRHAAIEWLAPKGFPMYGLLGGELRPDDAGFSIEIASTPVSLDPFEDAIASKQSDDVRGGLLDEFVHAVVDGMIESAKKQVNLPRATISCDIGVCGMVGSTPLIFKILGKALFEILIMREESDERDIQALLVFDKSSPPAPR
jgi:hypothetical protein